MGRVHRSFLPGARIYACSNCRAHLTNHEDIVSKSFQGRTGRAYLFNNVINVTLGPVEDRILTTGLHKVRGRRKLGRRKLRWWDWPETGAACCSEQAASMAVARRPCTALAQGRRVPLEPCWRTTCLRCLQRVHGCICMQRSFAMQGTRPATSLHIGGQLCYVGVNFVLPLRTLIRIIMRFG